VGSKEIPRKVWNGSSKDHPSQEISKRKRRGELGLYRRRKNKTKKKSKVSEDLGMGGREKKNERFLK